MPTESGPNPQNPESIEGDQGKNSAIKHMEEMLERKNRPMTEKEKEELWLENEFELNGKNVELYGVAHHPDMLDIPEYRQKLLDGVKRSSLVVLEGAPAASGYYTEEYAERVVETIQSLTDNELDRAEVEPVVHKAIHENRQVDFFKEVEAMAADEGKRIATLDPKSKIDAGIKLDDINSKVQIGKMVSMVGGMGIPLVMAMRETRKLRKARNNQELPTSTINRRQFLKAGLAATGLAVGVSSGISTKSSFDEKFFGRDINDHEPGVFTYDLMDYRDVSVAEGLDEISKEEDLNDGPIMVVYGAAHANAIEHYSKNPSARKAKSLLYAPYRLKAEAEINIYDFDKEKGWEKVEK